MKVYLRNIIIMLLALSPFVAFSDYLQEAGEAYAGYDFAESERLAREGLKALRNKKSEPLYSQLTNIAEKAALGNRLLKHAQHILVIDSISVPAEEFLNHFRIPASAGKILTDDLLPAEFQEDFQMAFANENADFLILSPNPLSPSFQLPSPPSDASSDSIPANLTPSLFQTNLLTDGTWSTPTPLPQEVNDITPMLPFLTNDGSLLYFASDNPEESLGGYDLFVASRDPSDDSYLEPSNLGMPFNSPYNDLMLALDEENGVGWWASDRSRIPGMITIYIYVIPKERMEISEQDDAVALASLNDFRLTWPEDMETLSPEYEELLEKIKEIGLDEEVEAEDFRLPMPGGKVYKLFSDFRNPASPDIMQQYLDLETVQIDELDELSSLRREYSRNRTDSSVRSRIRALEKTTEHRDTQMRHLLSNIYRLETGN